MNRNLLIISHLFLLLLNGCGGGGSDTNTDTPTTSSDDQLGCPQLESFVGYSNLVTASCAGDYVNVYSETGLPEVSGTPINRQMMVGITNWINRVAIPYEYNWRIPRNPIWLHNYEEASAQGPIAMAINGVPIFHLEARPNVSTDPSNYNPNTDTVLNGELDQCGGHSGQGEDYHYHYAPVCLLDNHDFANPIAYGLDGIPVYYGTGGTDYYGGGRYNNLNYLPAQALDECNALFKDDGTYEYYTTADPPYTIGCHRGAVDLSLQITPGPYSGREQGSPVPSGLGLVGEALQTRITNFYLSEDGSYHLEYQSGSSATIYKKVEGFDDCWEFEFRADINQPGIIETYCR